MKISQIAAAIEKYAPRENAFEWDNVGLMLGDADAECTGVLVCLDCTFAVALQARDEGCNLIVSHHPFIFKPMDRLTLDDPKAKMVRFLFRNNIAVYSAHTNLDIADEGLAHTLAGVGLLSGGKSHHRRIKGEIGDKADGSQVGGAILVKRANQGQRIGRGVNGSLHDVQFSHRVSSFQSDLKIDIPSPGWYNYYT